MVSSLPTCRFWFDVANEFVTAVLAEELEMAMRLLGITALDQLKPDMVNAAKLLKDMWRPDAFEVKSKL